MKKHIILALNLILGLQILSAQEADAEYLVLKRQYTIHNNGSMTYNFRKELKLNSQRAFFSIYGESFIVYNSEFQELTINEAYTIRKDGSKVAVPQNAFVEQLPSNCANCGRYNQLREMVVVHTALEKGATIVLDYTIESKQCNLSEKILFAEDAPIRDYSVTVSMPSKWPLYHFLKNGNTNNFSSQKKGSDNVFSWHFTNLEQSTAEYHAPSKYELYPVLYLAAEKTYDNILYQDKTIPESAENFIKSLSGSRQEKLNAIQDYVINGMTLNNVSLPQMYNIYSDAVTVWNSNCGNIYEKTVLFNALLCKAGFNSRICFEYDTLTCGSDTFFLPTNNVACVKISDENGNTDKYYAFRKQTPAHRTYGPVNIEQKYKIAAKGNTVTVEGGNNPKMEELAPNSGFYTLSVAPEHNSLDISPEAFAGKRTKPIVCKKTSEKYHYVIVIPQNVEFAGKALNINRQSNFGRMVMKIEQKGNTLDVTRKLEITTDRIPAAECAAFRKFCNDWNNPVFSKLVFKVKSK